MLINLRNALMAGKRLPYDAEVEYLESTGTQYIDTGFIPSSNTSVEIGYKTADAQLNTVLFGRRVAYNNKTYCIWANANGKIRFDYALNTTDNKDGPNSIVGSWVDVSKRKERNFVNGIEYTPNETKTFACDGNAYLFGMNNNGTANRLISAQISYCKIWDNGVLVRDFIPVRKGTVGYLYDRVSGKLFGNAGTGDFVLGPDVVPVEWLQSSGTQWINTGILPTSSTVVSGDFRRHTQFGDWRGLFGSGTNARSEDCFCVGLRNNGYVEGFVNGLTNKYIFTANNDRFSIEMTVPQITVVRGENTYTALTGKTSLGESSRDISIFRANNGDANLARPCAYYCYGFQISNGADLARSFRAVRVGTEGAMMDVLTRRIYRNAGTGAFGYGNDLRYPIPAA